MRDGNDDIINMMTEYPGFSLPMRDGNCLLLKSIAKGTFGFSLPMRDGNYGKFGQKSSPWGFSLPMRDGNWPRESALASGSTVLAYL